MTHIVGVVENPSHGAVKLQAAHCDIIKMHDLFVSKYGEPTSEGVTTVQNRAGASFESHVYRWTGKNVSITVSEYGSRLDESEAFIQSSQWSSLSGVESRENADKNKDKF